jgi:dTDP-4-amino-4,6-dideoxygalactose transaminase
MNGNLRPKRMRSASDLAIHGATPAFREPLHVGRPHVGDLATFHGHLEAMFERNWLTNNGPLVLEFESRIAAHLGVGHCVAMCNGTVALEIAIRALGMEGEVIVPSFTFIATAHALHWQGITPVFADIDQATHNLDPAAVRRAITPRTTGIIGVHVWGRPAPTEALQEIADEFELQLLFDAAHAFGCSHNGRTIGGFGRAEVLSFHATKAFNTFEGGAVVTNDAELAEQMRLMRNFGFAGYDDVVHPGTNGKMVEVCAAMGLTNLEALPKVVDRNRDNYVRYRRQLAAIPGVSMVEYDHNERNNYHYVVAEIHEEFGSSRDEVIAALQAENVLARRYFWPGCHRMKPYRDLFPETEVGLPNTRAVAERVVVLPTGAMVGEAEIGAICDIVSTLRDGSAGAN